MSSTRPATTLTPFHCSSRTAVSLNPDIDSGQRLQVMTTSRLELCWIAGELRIDCRASRGQMDALQDRPRTDARGTRGSL